MINWVKSHPLSALRDQSIENWTFGRAWSKVAGYRSVGGDLPQPCLSSHVILTLVMTQYLLQQTMVSVIFWKAHRNVTGEKVNFFYDLDNNESPVLWIVLMSCPSLLNAHHWGELGDFLLAIANLVFSYPDSQYMPPCKSKTIKNYLWQKLLIQEFLHLSPKAI